MGVLALFRQVRARTFWRAISTAGGQRMAQVVLSVVFGLFMFAGVFFLSLFGFRVLLAQDADLAAGLLAGVCTAAALGVVMVGTATAIYTMYLSEDLALLSSLPLRERTIIAYKFWETLVGDSAVFVVFALPALFAYGAASGANVAYYPALALVCVLLLMIPTALCVVLVIPLMRVLPASKAKEIVGALGILTGGAFYAVQQLFLARSGPGAAGASPLQALAEAPLLNVPPGAWAADALTGAASVQPVLFLSGLLPLAATAAISYAACLWVTGWAYATGRARAAESGGRVRPSGWTRGLFWFLPADVRGVAAKDVVMLPRDLRRLAALLVPVAVLIPMALVNFDLFFSLGRGEETFLLVPHLAVAALCALVSLSAGSLTVSFEGRSYWFLAASPLRPLRLLAGKCAAAAVPGILFAIAGSLLVSAFFGLYVPGLLLGVAGGVAASVVSALYAVGISALFPRFDWENPNQAGSPANVISGAVCLLGLAVFAGVLILPALSFGDPVPTWARLLAAAGLWTAISAVPGYAILAAGAANLKKLEWDL